MFGFFEDIAKLSGLPFEIFNNNFKVINFGNNAIYIENYSNIITFEKTEISVKLSKGVINILGENLKIKNMNVHSIIITGKIKSLDIS